jgi:phycocyanobilin lyase subunit beta
MSDTALAEKLIRDVEAADSAMSLVNAVQALSNARLEAAIPTLIATLAYNNPGAAVAAVDGLIGIGDPAVNSLMELLDGYNYTARAWAIRALAGIGDPRGLPVLLDSASNDFAMSVRRAATRGLGTIRWHLMEPEDVNIAQQQCQDVLFTAAQDPEWVVRYAAIVGLQSLAIAAFATQPQLVPAILEHLEQCRENDQEVAIQARIQLAQQQITKLAETLQLSFDDYKTPENSESDWHNTLQRLYKRKSEERPLREGDPRRFRPVAESITSSKTDSKSSDTTNISNVNLEKKNLSLQKKA